MMLCWLALWLGPAALGTSGDRLNVAVNPEGVEVQAQGVPLADVLARLERLTGMKVQFDGPAPRQNVIIGVRRRTQAEAVLAVLSGQGLNYLAQLDVTGTKVDTLLILAGTTTPPGKTAPAPRVAPPIPAPESPDAEDVPPPPELPAPEPPENNPPFVINQPPPATPLPGAAGSSAYPAGPLRSPFLVIPTPTPAPVATPQPQSRPQR